MEILYLYKDNNHLRKEVVITHFVTTISSITSSCGTSSPEPCSNRHV